MSRGGSPSTVWDHDGRSVAAVLHDRTVDMIGGYQLIRRLGAGPRAEVYLGHAGPELEAAGRRNAAIKLYRSDLERQSIDDEIEALTLARSRHLLSLRDIATGADGRPCLIFQRLRPTTLARLLAERDRLDPGEAVTILVPLSTAIGQLHSAGVVHGGMRPGSVFFDDAGAPVLACFGRSSRLRLAPAEPAESGQRSPTYVVVADGDSQHRAALPATPAQLAWDSRVADDLLGLVSIAASVLARVADAQTLATGRDLLAWLESDEPHLLAERLPTELSNRLFDFADGTPVDLAATDETGHEPAVRPLVFPGFGSPAVVSPTVVSLALGSPALGSFGLARRAARTTKVPMSVPTGEARRGLLARTATKARVAAQRVRRPFWVVGTLGLAAVVSAVVVFPSTAATDVGRPGARATRSPQPTRAAPTPAASTRTAPKQSGEATESTGKESDKSIAGDDPIAATVALLLARERCMSTLSVICLDGVDQEGSAALDGDRQVIRSLQEKGTATRERSLAGATVELSQRLGDSALMTITATTVPNAAGPDLAGPVEENGKPTSLLLIRSEAGWRIRDLFRG
jgi:serine/threonine protein kinase